MFFKKTNEFVLYFDGLVKGPPSFGGAEAGKKLIELGLRAKFEVRSFLPGDLIISFDLYPDIFALMDQLPIKEIAKNIETTTRGIERLVNLSDLQNMFTEVKQAMLSFRLLAEYLEQYPEAILKGVYNF